MKTPVAFDTASLLPRLRKRGVPLVLAIWVGAAVHVSAFDEPVRSAVELKSLSLEELLDTRVITASRTLEDWTTAPTAIGILTQEEIQRSGATRLADALRSAPGLDVARYVGSSYAISARGFSGSSVNKMQVMLDGRSLFTPLFSGVFWETQDTLLEDIDRIEVVRGPGAALWGANAVNGVINIITKNARDTQGALVTAGAGTEEQAFGGIRYGGKIGDDTYYRTYFKYQKRDEQVFSNGTPNHDGMNQQQGGFRLDSNQPGDNTFTLQGDVYWNDFQIFGRTDAENNGGNLLGRWTHAFSPVSDLQVQVYYDRGVRDVPLQFRESRSTYDLDAQYHLKTDGPNDFVIGAGYRNSRDETGTTGRTFIFSPNSRTLTLINFFAQDEITLIPRELTLSLGSKFEHNDYSGLEVQPSVRLAYIPATGQVVWAAVSRAVRAPTRVDTDSRFLPAPATGFVFVQGSPDFESEDLLAYELGYRVRASRTWLFDFATFYNEYNDLRTLEPSPVTGLPLLIKNERYGNTYGGEVTVTFQAADWWQLSGSYSYIHENLRFRPGSHDPTGGSLEGDDPAHLARLHCAMNLPGDLEFDWTLRYSSRLPLPALPAYTELDMRLAWKPARSWEIALVGQNLLHSHHAEFSGGASQPEVQRGGYAQVTYRY